jgi:molybdate transport system substrate-binding protein
MNAPVTWRNALLLGRISRLLAAAGILFGLATGEAKAETVDVYSAGSLRAVVAALAAEAAPMGIEVRATFDGAGALRARIEKGERPDLFLSADMASPRTLASTGRTVVPGVPFARNRMCLVAPRSVGLTSANLVDTLLAKDIRLKTSTPMADPAGDYAMAMFDRIDAGRPGAGAILRAKAAREMAVSSAPPAPGQSPVAALFLAHQIDVAVTYCSAAPDLQKAVPGLASLAVPADLDPHPVYGLAVLTAKPAAMRVALLLLSETGQNIVSRSGLLPISGLDER